MNKTLFLILIVPLIFLQKSYAETQTFKTYTPLTPQQYRFYNGLPMQNYYNRQIPYKSKNLSNIERRLFNQNYHRENPEQRLSRIEQQLFGTVQSGNIGQRYQNIQNYMTSNGFNPYYQRPIASKLRDFAQIFSQGQLTGITPAFNSPFDNSNYGFQDGWTDSNGNYYYNNYNMQNGMTVKLLD